MVTPRRGVVRSSTAPSAGAIYEAIPTNIPRTLLFDEIPLVGVGDTTAETSLLATTMTVPANLWEEGTVLKLILSGSINNNTGVDRDVTVRIKEGADSVFTLTFAAIPTSATLRTWRLDAVVQITTVFGLNFLGGGLTTLSATSATDDVISRTLAPNFIVVDPSAPIVWDITTQMSAASASLHTALFIGVIEWSTP